jgi:hypothetical protein
MKSPLGQREGVDGNVDGGIVVRDDVACSSRGRSSALSPASQLKPSSLPGTRRSTETPKAKATQSVRALFVLRN